MTNLVGIEGHFSWTKRLPDGGILELNKLLQIHLLAFSKQTLLKQYLSYNMAYTHICTPDMSIVK